MINLFWLGAMLCAIWMPYTDTLTVGLLLMLTMRPKQVFAYLFLLWWVSLWVWTEQAAGSLYFLPEQSIYVFGVILLFAKAEKPKGLVNGEEHDEQRT